MKSYKSKTANGGTTIILESVAEAIAFGRKWYKENTKAGEYAQNTFGYAQWAKDPEGFEGCVKAITEGSEQFKKDANQLADKLVDIVDEMKPIFTKNRKGVDFSDVGGWGASPELAAQGESKMFMIDKGDKEDFELKQGKGGEGAYRIIINTDIFRGGDATDNSAMVAGLITVLQRFSTVEVFIQQGWIGGDEKDGVTLFKLDYSTASDISNLVFWVSHPGKDIPFSLAVNRGLGRRQSGTSCVAEIPCDIMLRGDLMRQFEFDEENFASQYVTEQVGTMANWIAMTAFKILFQPENMGDDAAQEYFTSHDRNDPSHLFGDQKPDDEDDDNKMFGN